MDEITAGYGVQLKADTYMRFDVIHRTWGDFYVTRRDLSTGQATTPTGSKVDVGFIENSSSGLDRTYNALQLQGQTKFFQRVTVGGNYTYSKLRGNVEGEEFNNATVTIGAIGTTGSNVYQMPEYPQYTKFAQNNPVGYLAADMRHRANVWAQYRVPVPYGQLDLSLLERYHSAIPYSALAILSGGFISNPGYALPPTQIAYYIGGRGAYRLDNITETSATVGYTLPLMRANLFFKFDFINLLNQQGLEQADTSAGPVISRTVTIKKQWNPFTDTPVEGTNYTLASNFGQPTNKDAFQTPRTYRFAVGLRF